MDKRCIKIIRKNSYVSYANTLSVFVNDEKYELPSNSTITTYNDDKQVQITVKFLWAKSKVKLNNKEQNFTINIRPLVSNKILFFSVFTLLSLFVLRYYYESNVSELIFKTVGFSFIGLMFFLSTIGSNYFYKIDVNTIKTQ